MGKQKLFIPHEAMRFAGFRALMETAQQIDDPVHAALGMYLFSHAAWLAREMQRGGFDRIVFIARDGYWVKRAYDLVAPALGVDVPSDYVRISRQAAFPLHFRTQEDFNHLPEWVQVTAHTEKSLMQLLAADLTDHAADSADDTRLLTAADMPDFIRKCSENWYAQRAEGYRRHAKAYLQPLFVGKCATFDVGYNLRSEAVIREVTGADITAFITHTDSDVPDGRGVPYRTLYPASPYVSWVAREQFLLEDVPLCIGYDENGPVLASGHPQGNPGIRECQERALQFVEELVRKYGAELAELPFRPVDGCMPFEHFLHCARRRDMLAFRDGGVENDFHTGRAGEDGAFLQWRLMQTDLMRARGASAWRVRLKRGLIRLREEPRSLLRKLRPSASDKRREKPGDNAR